MEPASDLEAARSLPGTSSGRDSLDGEGVTVSQKGAAAASKNGQGGLFERHASSPALSSYTHIGRLELSWRALTYTVPVGWGRHRAFKIVLDGISGAAQPGQLLAVMGPTGSGKTSLIHALCGRLPKGGQLEGEVLVNGQPRGPGFRSMTAFVPQDDVLFANLTVRETLLFAARIRLPGSMSWADKEALAEQAITHLGLAKAADTLLGSPAQRGVSGGERKRVSIGMELLSSPSLLFLDEPTSGLDAYQAQNVMQGDALSAAIRIRINLLPRCTTMPPLHALLRLAGEGRTVVFSIHQPRSSIFAMFDRLILVAEGRLIYAGPAAAAAWHFEAAGHPCPPGFNPADFLLDLTSLDFSSPEGEAASRQRVQALADLWAAQQGASSKDAASEEEGKEEVPQHAYAGTSKDDAPAAGDDVPRFANGPLTEFRLLLGRAARQASRNRLEHIVLIFQTVIIASLFAILYSNMSPSNPGGVQDEVSLLFLCAVTVAMNSMMGCILLFSLERQVTGRERASRAYRVAPYYLSRLLMGLPLRFFQGILFSCIVYWAVGLNPAASAFFVFSIVVICEDMAGQALGLAVSAAVPHEKIALAIAPMLVIFLMLFSGFYVNAGTLPKWLSWIKYTSHLYYGLMGLGINNFQGREGWACPVGSPQPCSVSGDAILAQLGFGGDSLGTAFMGLLLLMVGFNALGYVCLRFHRPHYLPLNASAKKHQ